MTYSFFTRRLPKELEPLRELSLDLRWIWSHEGDTLWRSLAPEVWERTKNPWLILHNLSQEHLEQLTKNAKFKAQLQALIKERQQYMESQGWFRETHAQKALQGVAYFSMEFGLGEALPLYAGGLGILAGDYLKTASDLGVPVVGVGLLFQEGYFRQVLDDHGWQQEIYPYNEPASLPIEPVLADGRRLQIGLDLPGRTLLLRVWRAQVGKVSLYLLDSNDPLNMPTDRGITSKLYGGGPELRLMQETILGIGGWRLLEFLDIPIDICHLNEGHAALVVLERALSFKNQYNCHFHEALIATRAGNIFTTHTPVEAGFDRYNPALLSKYFSYIHQYLERLEIPIEELLALGRKDPNDSNEPFNMAYLALRGCARVNGVSRLHGEVSRRLFAPLYPRWPLDEIPVRHVTNGVHVPSWDSRWADQIWTEACGKGRWMGSLEAHAAAVKGISDQQLWAFQTLERKQLVDYARERLVRQLSERGKEPKVLAEARETLDPNVLTIGFARRFVEYKRSALLLRDAERLIRLLTHPERPVQMVVAGKAHPEDSYGKQLVQAWAAFVQRPEVRQRAIFLQDYDISLAQELVQGVDLWINTPRRPWEACGTSGMKVLVNGGLNLSSLDGWWDEAYSAEVGWAIGERRAGDFDAMDAEQLYCLLEREIVPTFYERNEEGIPVAWIARIRASMAHLAPDFSSNRMLREYVEQMYLKAAAAYHKRSAKEGELAKELCRWQKELRTHWREIHLGNLAVHQDKQHWKFELPVYLGGISPQSVQVQLYAEATHQGQSACQVMERTKPIVGAINGYFYRAGVPAKRPATDYTPRLIPYHPDASLPSELPYILWQR